jgi:hypothetical protein
LPHESLSPKSSTRRVGLTPLIAWSKLSKSCSLTSLPLKAITIAPSKKKGMETRIMAKSIPKSHHHQFRWFRCKGCGREVHGVDFGRFDGILCGFSTAGLSILERSTRKLDECDGDCNLIGSMVIETCLWLFGSGIGMDGGRSLEDLVSRRRPESSRSPPSDHYLYASSPKKMMKPFTAHYS